SKTYIWFPGIDHSSRNFAVTQIVRLQFIAIQAILCDTSCYAQAKPMFIIVIELQTKCIIRVGAQRTLRTKTISCNLEAYTMTSIDFIQYTIYRGRTCLWCSRPACPLAT